MVASLAESQLSFPRWAFAGGKPQGLAILQALAGDGFLPETIYFSADLPEADIDALSLLAEQLGRPVRRSEDLSDQSTALSGCDLLVTCRFGLLSRAVFEAPRWGAVNVHSSLLPAYRGVHPVSWALINGERCTGVTVHRIDAGVDTGRILLQGAIEVEDDDDIWRLTARLDALSAELMVQLFRAIRSDRDLPEGVPQTGSASAAPRRRPEDGRIVWSSSAHSVHNLCRALRPPLPPAFFVDQDGSAIAVRDSRLHGPGNGHASPGTVLAALGDDWYRVQTADGVLELQVEQRLQTGSRLS